MELRPAERDAFLDRECASDPSLRKDVDEMLSVQGRLDPGFLESPAAKQISVSHLSRESDTVLPTGTKFGNYEIRALLGAGGMGQVYRARDLLLKRDVAIKVIPNFYASDPARLHRFRQEAEATAALNHPNILTVYQIGEHEGTFYIVAELLQGDTLRDRLRSGPLPLRTATDNAVQFARGLFAAHDRGIIHRDLKPENIFVTKDGRIKILDFGLAKLIEQRPEHSASAQEAKSTQLTDPGLVLGTTAYMSPEQVRGSRVDHRSDIFAFGAVLYEMLTGHLAFAKPTPADTMTAILNEDPPALSQSQQNVPPGMQRVIQRCLEKQPERRFQSASDLAFALEALSDSGSVATVAASREGSARWMWVLASTGIIAVTILAFFWWTRSGAVPVVESVTQLTNDGEAKSGGPTDGSRVYFTEGDYGAYELRQVSLNGGETAPVSSSLPPVSSSLPSDIFPLDVAHDGSALLLSEEGSPARDLWLLPLPAGEPRRLVRVKDLGWAQFFSDGRIAYSDNDSNGSSDLFISDQEGKTLKKVATLQGSVNRLAVSPDAKSILVEITRNDNSYDVQIIGLDGSVIRKILSDRTNHLMCCFEWSPDQRYLYFTEMVGGRRDLRVFPLKTYPFLGPPEPVNLTPGPLSYSTPRPTPDGKRIVTMGTRGRGELVRFDPKSQQFFPYLSGISALEPTFSKEGKWVAYISYPDMTLWRSHLDGSERTQLTVQPRQIGCPFLSPDGTKVLFTDQSDVFLIDAIGSQPKKIAEHARGANWSPDGETILYHSIGRGSDVVRTFNLTNSMVADVPSSSAKDGVLWVDENTIVAADVNNPGFVTFDLRTQRWSDLLPGNFISWYVSFDAKYLYFTVAGKDLILKRIRFSDRRIETLGNLKNLRQTTNPFTGTTQMVVAPDGSALFTRDHGSKEIYALNLKSQ
jgi:Tol biopolymer transport system component